MTCPFCKGTGSLTAVNDDGDEIGSIDCIKCHGLAVQVGDHDVDKFNAVQDAVQNAMSEADYLPSPNPGFGEKV